MGEVKMDLQALDDRKLAERAQKGDGMAFRALVERYKDKVYNTIFRMLGNSAQADDAVQETFIRAYKGLGQFKKESTFSTWIFRIAVNYCLTCLRKTKTPGGRAPLSLDAPAAGEYGAGTIIADKGDKPEDRMARGEREETIQKAITSLVDELRQVVVLKDVEDLSYDEIAQILEIPVGTVKSRIFKAREILRGKLKQVLL